MVKSFNFECLAKQLKKQLKLEPENTLLMNKLAFALFEWSHDRQAVSLLKKAARLNPGVQTLTNLGWFYLHEGEPVKGGGWRYQEKKAIKVLKEALAYNPQTEFTYSVMGDAYLKIGQLEEAEYYFKKGIEQKARLENLNNLGVVVFKLGRIEEAAELFLSAHRHRNSTNSSLWPYLNYGVSLAVLGKKSEAEEVARFLLDNQDSMEIDMGPDESGVAEVYYETGNYKIAADLFMSCPYSFGPGLLKLYLYSLYQSGRKDIANDLYRETIQANEERIIETSTEDEWEENDRLYYIENLRSENQQIQEFMTQIKNGIRPPGNYEPYVESGCYLFGCIRHENPEYPDSQEKRRN